MRYLDIVRSVGRDENEESRLLADDDLAAGDEKNEQNEKRSPLALLSPDDAERLKTLIIAVVTAPSAEFDRARYDRLMARWLAHKAATETACRERSEGSEQRNGAGPPSDASACERAIVMHATDTIR